MTINGYHIDETLQLTPFAPERAAEMSQQADAKIWIDLQSSEPAEIETWLDTLAIRGLSRRLCLEALDHPGFYPLKTEILLVIRNLSETEAAGKISHTAFLYREHLLFTLHHKPVAVLHAFATEQDSDDWLPERSIAGLISALMNAFSLSDLQNIFELRESIFRWRNEWSANPKMSGSRRF